MDTDPTVSMPCFSLNTDEDDFMSLTEEEIENIAQYQCELDKKLFKALSTECHSYGQWRGPEPECRRKFE